MNVNDQHYTPAWLADRLAELLPDEARRVVDLAAGGGSLLRAVERRMDAGAVLVGADIDQKAVAMLRREHPGWVVSHANSLDPNSYRVSAAFRSGRAPFDAAVLNPPFSYRGGSRRTVEYRGSAYRVTPATAFVAHAHSWVRAGGVIVAIVPANVFDIGGDSSLWEEWSSHFAVETFERLNRNTFPNARMTTMVVRLALGEPPIRSLARNVEQEGALPWPSGACTCVHVVRGRVPVHRLVEVEDRRGVPFVHTTHIRNGGLIRSEHRVSSRFASSGPLILLPRVGTPTLRKLAVAEIGGLVLSDCVFGLRPADPRALRSLHDLVTANFSELSERYTGSCARYITVDRLLAWLNLRGLSARQVGAAEIAHCECSASLSEALA